MTSEIDLKGSFFLFFFSFEPSQPISVQLQFSLSSNRNTRVPFNFQTRFTHLTLELNIHLTLLCEQLIDQRKKKKYCYPLLKSVSVTRRCVKTDHTPQLLLRTADRGQTQEHFTLLSLQLSTPLLLISYYLKSTGERALKITQFQSNWHKSH